MHTALPVVSAGGVSVVIPPRSCGGAVACILTDSHCFPRTDLRALDIALARKENGGSRIPLTALQTYYIPK